MEYVESLPEPEEVVLAPQPGPQTEFLSTLADICFYGGAAGGGKSYGMILETLRHYDNPAFSGVVFRKERPQITNPGGLWDETKKLYPHFAATPNIQHLKWSFPSGATVQFSHLFLETDVLNWQGAQIPFIGFDEVTHFSKDQFFYMLSRLRSTSGVPGYVRATCNPDPDSWVAEFIEWWIDQESGLPYPERSGKLRWFVRDGDEIIWADSREELEKAHGKDSHPKSVTFISAKIEDNKILMSKDPSYLSNLKALSRVERAKLLDGNWKVRKGGGAVFQRSWFEIVDSLPPNIVRRIRYWDRAATEPTPQNPNPDWTAGVKLFKDGNGIYYVAHVERFRGTPLKVKTRIGNIASVDTRQCMVGIEGDPGQAGKFESDDYVRSPALSGYVVKVFPARVDKLTRALPASAAAENQTIKILRGSWNEAFLAELEAFDGEGKVKDDQVDAFSGAFNALSTAGSVLGATSQL